MKIKTIIAATLIWAAALSSVRADITTGLSAYLKLDETSGLTAADSSGNGNNGTLAGFPTDNSEWVTGITNGALQYWFNSSVVTIPDAPTVNFASTATFTLAAWVNLTVPGYPISPAFARQNVAGATLICKGYGTLEQYGLDLNQGTLRFWVNDASDNPVQLTTTYYPTNVIWIHVAAVYDGPNQRMELYTNGVLLASFPPGSLPTSLFANTHAVSTGNRELESDGSQGYDAPFMGVMDEVRIYSRALAPADIAQLAATPACAAPVIVVQPPSSITTYVGGNVHLAPGIRGCGPMTYQWKFYGTNLSGTANGAQSPQYDIYSASATSSPGPYQLAVTNAYGGTTSAVVTVTVGPEPQANLTAGLIAYWPFNETSDTNAYDASGNGNTAALYNFPGDNSQWGAGAINGALTINPNSTSDGQYLMTTNPLQDSTGNQLLGDTWTFSFWCKGYHSNTFQVGPFYYWDTVITPTNAGDQSISSYISWIDWFESRGIGMLQGGALDANETGTDPTPTTWHHMVAMYDRANGRYTTFYDNTKKANRVTAEYPSNLGAYWKPNPSPGKWLIGACPSSGGYGTGGDCYSGVLDELRVYNRWLNLNEIAALYYQGGSLAARPSLSVTNNQNGTVTISWPAGATAGGYQLQSSAPPTGPASGWTAVLTTLVPSADGNSLTLTVNATGSQYYRLQYQ